MTKAEEWTDDWSNDWIDDWADSCHTQKLLALDIETMPTPSVTQPSLLVDSIPVTSSPNETAVMQIRMQSDACSLLGVAPQNMGTSASMNVVTNYGTSAQQLYFTGSNNSMATSVSMQAYADYKQFYKHKYKDSCKHAKLKSVKGNWLNWDKAYTSSSKQIDYQFLASYTGGVTASGGGVNVYQGDTAAWPFFSAQVYNSAYPPRPETPEEKAAREAAQIKYQLEAEQRQKRQEVAATRAEQLLFAVISDQQRKQYIEFGYFETVVNDKVYRIKKGRAGNVMQLQDGKPKFKYCIHPVEFVPDQDTMLTQFLLLMTDEQHFLRTANRTVLY